MKYLIFLLILSCNESQFGADQPVDQKKRPTVASEGDAKKKIENELPGDIEITPAISIPQSIPNDPIAEKVMAIEFTAASAKNMKLSHDFEYVELTHELLRDRVYASETTSYTQINRTQGSKSFVQGSAGIFVEESLMQSDLGIIDILVVVDNSGSMEEEHAKISNKLPDLISQISGANWRIRVVSTDKADSCNQFAVINSDANNPTQTFTNYIQSLGIKGSGSEQGVLKANHGLDCPLDPWIRDASNLAVLIVSDEDNCSTSTCEADIRNSPVELKKIMAGPLGNSSTARQFGTEARVYGIYSVPGIACQEAYRVANIYHQLVEDSNGSSGSICDPDFTATFQAISADMKSQLKSNFKLQQMPDPKSLVVSVNQQTLEAGVDYNLQGDTIEFLSPPVKNANILVRYHYNSTPRYSEFDLGLDSIVVETVTINDVATTDFQIQGSKLVFTNQAPDNSTIVVTYRDSSQPLLGEFKVAENIKPNSLSAMVNGVPADVRFKEGGFAEFSEPPVDNASIEISYEILTVGELINKVPAENLSDEVSSISAWKASDQSTVEVAHKDGYFVLEADGLEEGDRVIIRYTPVAASDTFTYSLPYKPVDNTLKLNLVDGSGNLRECGADQFTVVDLELSVNCKLDNVEMIDLEFLYLPSETQIFNTEFPEPETAIWTVKVDGKEIDEFVREGSQIHLSDLPANAKVDVTAVYISSP